MPKYVVDTNVFIDVLRSSAERQAYERFLQHGLALTYVSAIVGMELLAGARSGAHALAIESDLLGPFQRRGRVFERPGPVQFHYERLLRAKGKPKATVAAARTLCLYIYWMWRDGLDYGTWLQGEAKRVGCSMQTLASPA